MNEPRRLQLKEGREHLTVTNEFQSDKYPWCPAGFVPLKVTDPMARDSLWDYARRRRVVDEEFTRDLEEALLFAGDSTPRRCEWFEDDDGWHGSCGQDWEFIYDGPTENSLKFCMNCGKPVEVDGLSVEDQGNV